MKVSAKARVRIIIDLNIPAEWGDDCTIGQIHKQALDEARQTLERLCRPIRGVTLISSEVAGVILAEEKPT